MQLDKITEYNMDPNEVRYYLNKIKNNESIVVVTGEFSGGKSCFLNAFIGKRDFLPHDNGECTPVLIDIMNSSEDNIIIKLDDGSEREVEATEENIKKYTKYTKDYDSSILSVSIPVESEFLKDNIHFIDSPGTNTIIKEHEEITNYILKKADIVIYTINKVISKTDIDYIKDILRYTEDIIFVVTHMDEINEEMRSKGMLHKDDEEINRLITSIKDEIMAKLEIEDADIFPVGSKAAYEDSKYIQNIRECIDSYIELNSINTIKKRVKKQLSILFDNRIEELIKENKFFMDNMSQDKIDIDDKIDSLSSKITKLNSRFKDRINNIDITAKSECDLLRGDIKSIFDREEKRLINKFLDYDEITEEVIEADFNESRIIIGQGIKEKIESRIGSLTKLAYVNVNNEINNLVGEIDIKLEANIGEPSILDLDDSGYENNISEIMKMKERCIKNLTSIEEEIASTEEEKEEIRESIKDINKTLDIYRNEMNRLGIYVPNYDEIVVDGSGEIGAKMGRVLGEVADLCLLITPVGAPTKVAQGSKTLSMLDKVKDTIKSISYIEKATVIKGRKPVKTATKIKRELEKVKRGTKAIVDSRNKVVNLGNEIAQTSENMGSIVDALDVLSIGYWGEKIGYGVGEMIKPTKTVLVENEQLKAEWEEKRYGLEERIAEYKIRRKEIEIAYEDAGSIKEKRKLKRDIEEKNNYYNNLLQEMEENQQRQQEIEKNSKIENYYRSKIKSIFTMELSNAEKTTMYIYNTAKEKITEKSEVDLRDKILAIEINIEKLTSDKDEIEVSINENVGAIETLKSYDNWIDEWVSDYAII